jgi:hypothetical protein
MRALLLLVIAVTAFPSVVDGQITFGDTGGVPFAFDTAIATGGFPTASDKELRLTMDGLGANAFSLRNTNNGGTSALTARDLDNREKFAIGWGNPGVWGPFANANYIETWSGHQTGGTIPEFFICADGDIGAGYQVFKRFRIKTNGDVSIPRRIEFFSPQEDAFLCEATTGAVTISPRLNDNAMKVRNYDPAGYSTAAFQDSSGVNRLFVGHGNASSLMPNQSYIMTENGGATPQDLLLCSYAGGLLPRLTITGNGNIVIGNGALATTATDGFLHIPTCNGPPSGTPTPYAGRVPMVLDESTGKLMIYSGGVWNAYSKD